MKRIYIIESHANGIITYKIGITSRDIKFRIRELQTGNHTELSVLFEFETNYASKIEKVLHENFNTNNIKNEWFNDELNISLVKEQCLFYNRLFNSIKDNPFI